MYIKCTKYKKLKTTVIIFDINKQITSNPATEVVNGLINEHYEFFLTSMKFLNI